MKIVENHQEIFDQVFSKEIPEDADLSNLNDHWDLEELNPIDSIEVAEFSSEVENYTTWIQHSYFYVCEAVGFKNTYLLFDISWDDNWGRWQRQSWSAVTDAKNLEEASKYLLRDFASNNVRNSVGEWKEFLKQFI